ncbi:MAG: hypothetical protein FJ290_04705 [Planctomycetes bacterium]|nr:hypothetical protein [Planctomycetota bacterium]
MERHLATMLLAAMLAIALRAAPAARGAEEKQRAEALLARAAATDFGARYEARYLHLRPDADVRAMERENRSCREELARLNPANAGLRIALGALYVEAGEADKAIAEFNAALGLPKLSPFEQGDALTGLASAALLKGDRNAAIQHCKDLVARDLNTTARYRLNPVNEAKYALQFLNEPELDYLKLPYHTSARAFPTPQQATYTEEFVPLAKVALDLGGGLKPDDPRIRLLRTKFTRFGIAFADPAPFLIRVNAAVEPKAPEKPEGYALRVTRGGAVINGRDPQGVLWGIVSLIQLVDREAAPRVRVCDIVDWPDTARRGFLQGYWKDALEFMLFCKMNTVVSQSGVQITDATAHQPWTPLQSEICKGVCAAFTAFGLKHYFGIRQWTMYPKIPLSSDRTLDLHAAVCSEVAKHGGHIYFPFDDSRFPLPKADLDTFEAGANLDAKYVTRLFRAVREKHPGFHLVFCPPFYWGPDSRASYPEPREPYLKSLGDHLDPGVEVIWTGPRVKGYQKNKEQVAWFTGLTKHKPFLFQNGTGPHNLLSYITDETPQWRTWHYDGFFENDIEGFLKNAHMGMEAPQTTTLADCLWNVRGYDAAASIRRGVAMLYGKEMFDILDPANKALAYLDKYKYGEVTPEAPTEIPEIERRLKIAEEAVARGKAYNAFSLENFPGALERGVGFARAALAGARKPPDFFAKYKKDIEETRELAAKEVGVGAAKGDILKLPTDFLGGTLLVYDNKCPRRFASLIRGRQTPNPRVTTRFECDPFPPSGPYELHLCAQDDDAEAPCRIRIKVNDTVVFEAPSGFARYGWSIRKFALPLEALQRGNLLTIECTEDSAAQQGPPWFMVNYAVLRSQLPRDSKGK